MNFSEFMEKLNTQNVRVRIAPSPTGLVHIGNLRTILYNFLFAKHYKGKFLIRIEDTDQTRKVPGAVENLLKVLEWANIEGDEGPYLTKDGKVKERGDFGPYTQSARLEIYKQHIHDLLDKNKAYHCFCSKERLDSLREDQIKNKQAPKYDNLCRDLSKDEVQSLLKQGTPHVIRFRMPENKDVICDDLIRGEIIFNTKNLDDYVLMKADGFPTYHFANVIDDHLMKITQVLRGDEWIASTPKHVLLYEAFGWQMPQFAHLPQLLNKTRKKLSKRDGDASVSDFVASGYLKEALLNFIALLGWNAGTEQEVYTFDELINQFSLDNVHKAGAVFDVDKLDWINGIYMRESSDSKFLELAQPYLAKAELLTFSSDKIIINETGGSIKPTELNRILTLEKSRIKKLSDLPEAIDFMLKSNLEYPTENLVWKKSDKEQTKNNLKLLLQYFNELNAESFSLEKIEADLKALIQQNNLDTGSILWPLRYALSGKDKSPGPFELASALGKEKTTDRIQKAIDLLV
ncbi:MAG: Glutamate-tRNA ligase [Parcubacteria group bacterium GW2011_GWC2_38_7]|nr:MAG: Glutamate-tRNA ligase [Parcubacteria group bacterium GW2011_GWC2_38_7]